MVAMYAFMFLMSIGSISLASDNANVASFLQGLSSKKKTTSVANGGEQNKEDAFLGGLSQLKQQQTDEQKNLKQEEAEQEQKEEAGLHFIVDFYGNPKYQSAMRILNDAELQQSYQQELNSIHMFFFEYAQKIIGKHHTTHKHDDSNQQSVSSFLQTVKSQSPVVKPQKVLKRSKVKKGSVNSVSSFLAHLKGS